jgi:hypothetical protein
MMKFATAKNHPKEELQEAAQWYAEALGSGAIESWRHAGLALDEFGRVVPHEVGCYKFGEPRCNHQGAASGRAFLMSGRVVSRECPHCKEWLARSEFDADRQFNRDLENDRAREAEPYDAALWSELLIAALPWRKDPVPDNPFFLGKGLAGFASTKRSRLTFRKLRDTDKDLLVPFDPADNATQKDIWLAVMQARWRSWWRGLPARMYKRAASMMPRDGGLQRAAFIFELRNNGYMLADGRRWQHRKKPARKIAPGLPAEMAQLRMLGLKWPEIGKRYGMLESQIRLLVRKASIRARSASNSRMIDSSNSKSDMLVTSEDR